MAGELIRLNERAPKTKRLRLWWEDIVEDFDIWGNDLVARFDDKLWDIDGKALVSGSNADIHPSEKIRGVIVPPMCRIGLVRRFAVPPPWRKDGDEYAPVRFNGYVPLLKDVELPWHRPEELAPRY